jgi:hypothetical protein
VLGSPKYAFFNRDGQWRGLLAFALEKWHLQELLRTGTFQRVPLRPRKSEKNEGAIEIRHELERMWRALLVVPAAQRSARQTRQETPETSARAVSQRQTAETSLPHNVTDVHFRTKSASNARNNSDMRVRCDDGRGRKFRTTQTTRTSRSGKTSSSDPIARRTENLESSRVNKNNGKGGTGITRHTPAMRKSWSDSDEPGRDGAKCD